MQSGKVIVGLAGIALIMAAIGLDSFKPRLTNQAEPAYNTASLKQNKKYYSASTGQGQPASPRSLDIAIRYPEHQTVSQTTSVKIILREFEETINILGMSANGDETLPTVLVPVESTDYVAGSRVSSAGFSIEPDELQEKEVGSRYPVEFSWTIRPEKSGLHTLDIDLANLLLGAPRKDLFLTTSFNINDKNTTFPNTAVLSATVEVLTDWGIRKTTEDVLRGIVGLIGFVLTYPLLIHILKSRVKTSGIDKD